MPELPEVETIVQSLRMGTDAQPSLLGHTFQQIDVFWPRSVAEPDAESFKTRLCGQRIEELGRRGKFIVFQLDQDFMLIHLRMSGDMRTASAGSLQVDPSSARHERVVFLLSGGLRLAFHDTRKFGRVWLVKDMGTVTGHLGPEPLESSFSAEWLFNRLQQTRRQIKPLLMDQHFLAGLGNIYTDEALHLAGIHPILPANQINSGRAERLQGAIQHVLREGIKNNGSSIDWVYRGGNFQNNFNVYQRSGSPCLTCGTEIVRSVVAQRGTHYCPVCQPLSEERE